MAHGEPGTPGREAYNLRQRELMRRRRMDPAFLAMEAQRKRARDAARSTYRPMHEKIVCAAVKRAWRAVVTVARLQSQAEERTRREVEKMARVYHCKRCGIVLRVYHVYCPECGKIAHKEAKRRGRVARHMKYPELRRQEKRRHEERHPERTRDHYRIRDQRNRAKELGLEATMRTNDWLACVRYFDGVCAYCGKPPGLFDMGMTLHADHFIPLASPGCPGTVAYNIIPACQDCNSQKGDQNPYVWVPGRFGVRKGAFILSKIEAYFASLKGGGHDTEEA